MKIRQRVNVTEVKRGGEKEGDGVTAELKARHVVNYSSFELCFRSYWEGPVVSNGWGQDWMRRSWEATAIIQATGNGNLF